MRAFVAATALGFALVNACIPARPQTPTTNPPDQTHGQPQLDPQLAKARVLLQNGSVTEADQSVRRYLESHPESSDAHYLLGLILFKENRPKDSLAEYTAGAQHRGPSAYDLEVVALNYVLLGDYMNADTWLTKSVSLDSHNWQSWYYLGRTKYNENRFEEAIHAFEQCIKLSPENVKAEDNLGLSYAGLGRAEEAEAAYREALRWQSQLLEQDPGPYLDLGILLIEQNRPQEAVGYLARAAQIAPEDPRTHEHLGKAYDRLNDLPKAQTELEKAVAAKPDDPALHFLLGQVYRREGFKEKAKAEFDRSAMLNGTHSNAGNPTTMHR
jgi:Flp pilus assembly protein TadD